MDSDEYRISPDGIVEALLEVRFETSIFPEIAVGNLISGAPWKQYTPIRLPAAEIPHFVRANDSNLKFQPTLQLNADNGLDVVKVGENVLSVHRLGSYPGWERFGPSLHETVEILFAAIDDIKITRLGFRYINLLGAPHGIASISDLNVDLAVGGQDLRPPINLNYLRHEGELEVLVRAASPEFVQGPPSVFGALIDIDVYTESREINKTRAYCTKWIEKAHILLKQRFFELLDENTIGRLRGE